jgi:DNA helicase HerA-like ATPase
VSAFEQFTDATYNRFAKKSLISSKKLIRDFIYRKLSVKKVEIPIMGIQLYSNVSILNNIEMATVFHFPNKDVGTPNIVWLGARRSSAPIELPEDNEGIHLGKSVFRGVEKKIFIRDEDRARHCYIIGQTGTGKSWLLKYIAIQDIKRGEGVAIIDPHGTDIDDILQQIPPERIKDVILWFKPLGGSYRGRKEHANKCVHRSFVQTL